MSVQTPANSNEQTTEEPALVPGRTGSAGRSILASLVAGALIALLLSLVVFPGATEATVTGSILFGFGLGWALVATLTARRTSQPQRWAVVPAVAMGATGIALLACRPGDDLITALNWVWPPVMLALVVWMFGRMRGSLHGGGRWLLTPVIGVLALTALGATYSNIALSVAALDTSAAPGAMHDVDGRQLPLEGRGPGGPTVGVSNGLGEVSALWARITGPLARTTRVCGYDRAGQGWSEAASTPQDGVESAEELHALLAAAGQHGPYVLVGHSTGGPYAMTYAAQ